LVEFETYRDGEFKSATDDKADTAAAIKGRSGDTEEVDGETVAKKDGGALFEAKEAKKLLWEAAVEKREGAAEELTTTLDGTDLAALRKAVADATDEWDIEQGKIDDL